MSTNEERDMAHMAYISMQRSNSNAFVLNFEPQSLFYKKLMAKVDDNPELLRPFVVFNSLHVNPRLGRQRPIKPNLILATALRNLREKEESIQEDKPLMKLKKRSQLALRRPSTSLPVIFDLKDIDSKLRILDITLDKSLEAVRDLNRYKTTNMRLRAQKIAKRRALLTKRREPKVTRPTADRHAMAFSSHSISSNGSKSDDDLSTSLRRSQSSAESEDETPITMNEIMSNKKEQQLVNLMNKLDVEDKNTNNEINKQITKLPELKDIHADAALREDGDSRATLIPMTKYEDMSKSEQKSLRGVKGSRSTHHLPRPSLVTIASNARSRKMKFPPVLQLFGAKQTLSIERTRRMLEGQVKSSLSGVHFADTGRLNLTNTLCQKILQQICSEATALQDLKIIVNLVIFENLKQGANVSTQCLWNPDTDVFASTKVYLKNMIIVACVQIVKKLQENNVSSST